jgi:hypothetical protein
MPRSMLSHLLLLLTVMPGVIVSAQTFGGGTGGTIIGPSGAPVAGAAIPIEEVDTGLKWKPVRVVDVQPAVGQSNQTVIVHSEDACLDSATSQVAAVNTAHVARELPLNGRDWTTLASLQPWGAIGIDVTNYGGGGPASGLGVDAIDELSIITENASAQYERTLGGAIGAMTRTGPQEITAAPLAADLYSHFLSMSPRFSKRRIRWLFLVRCD